MFRSGKLPQVTLKWAQTLDGQLADDSDQSQWISGPEERKYTHELRSNHQAVLVGAQTFLKDLCQLTVRDFDFSGLQPARVIIDPRGRVIQALKEDPKLIVALRAGPRRTFLLTDIVDDEEESISRLFDSIKLIRIRYRFNDFKQWLTGSLFQLAHVFEIVEKRRLDKLMVEGGAATLSQFLKSGLVNHLEVAISPLILGGGRHRVDSGSLLKDADRFDLISKDQLGSDILVRYKVREAATQSLLEKGF